MWCLIIATFYLTCAKAYEYSTMNLYAYASEDLNNLAHSGVVLPRFTYPVHHHQVQNNEPSRISLNNNNNPYLSTVTQYDDTHQGSLSHLPTGIINYPLNYGRNVGPKQFLSEPEPMMPLSNVSSYYEDLVLVENFGNYLKKATFIDPHASPSHNDAAHQYNALLTVINALGRNVRNACTDFDLVYDQAYYQTVNTYYQYGLANADRVGAMIEDYIRKGINRIPKLLKLQQECQKHAYCSVAVDRKIKISPLLYAKELETLGALSQLARSYYTYMEEFNQAAQGGRVLSYLHDNKERIKNYIMHVVNSVNHVTDVLVTCT